MRRRRNGEAAGAPATPVSVHHLPVTRTARYCTLGGPGPELAQVWIACHGYGELAADFLDGMRALEAGDRWLIAPEALSRFYMPAEDGGQTVRNARVGASWMTREDSANEVADYVGYLERLYRLAREAIPGHLTPRVFVLGFSQGVPTVARWAARTRAPIDDLILWGGRMPELDYAEFAERWRQMRITLVVGTRDHWVDEDTVRAAAAQLREHGIPCRVIVFNGGHRLDDDVLLDIAR